MPTILKTKNSVTTTVVPTTLQQGELAVNITDKKLWVGNAATTPVQLLGDGGSASFTSIAFGAGTVSAPSITFTGDTNTGIYSPAADTIAFTEGGVESMRINSSGNLGLGTTTPAAKLDVVGTTYFRGAGIIQIFNGNTIEQVEGGQNLTLSSAFAAMPFLTAGSERMRITSAGLVGIGTSSPTNIFDVTGAIRSVGPSNAAGGVGVELDYGGSAAGVGRVLSYDRANGLFKQLNFQGQPIAFVNGGTEAMRIDSSGQLLVGTTSALAQTTIYKAASGLQSSSPQLTVQNGVSDGATGDGPGINFANSSGAVANIGITGDGAILFSNRASTGAGWAERMRLISGGQLIIGKTSTAFGTNGIYFNQVGQGLYTYENNADTGGAAIYLNRRTFDGAVMLFYKDTNNIGSISVTASATAYNTSSDYRLKENIAPMAGALTTVAQLKPVTYKWKSTGETSQGFIAHELAEVVPDAVTGEKDGVETVDDLDEDGKKIGTKVVPKYQGIDTSFLVATLTAAIQEQQALIENLTTRLTALESK
jgi:hypothetical protein